MCRPRRARVGLTAACRKVTTALFAAGRTVQQHHVVSIHRTRMKHLTADIDQAVFPQRATGTCSVTVMLSVSGQTRRMLTSSTQGISRIASRNFAYRNWKNRHR